MTTKTHDVRLAIQSRLASLCVENGKVADVQAVLNPIGARSKDNLPEKGCYAVLWTLDGEAIDFRLNTIHWRQLWAIDIPLDWQDDDEQQLDQIKLELASVLLPKIPGIKKQTLSSLKTSYPANGSGRSLISVEIVTEYIESF
jgi:hypothetical protein